MKKIVLALFALLFALGIAAAPAFAGPDGCDGGCCPLPPDDGGQDDNQGGPDGCDGGSCPLPPDDGGQDDSQGVMPDGCDGGSCPLPPDDGPDGTDDGGLH